MTTVTELYNQVHSPRDGKFASGSSAAGPKSLAHMTDRQLAASNHPLHRAELKRRQSENKEVFLSANVEAFYNHVHDHATGKFSGRAAGKSTTVIPQGPQHGNRGGPVVGAKLPLRNATTGRLNPTAVRHAFKQGTSEIIGKKTDSLRTSGSFKGLIAGKTVKVKTSTTYKGRTIRHEATGGRAPRYTKTGPLAPKFIQRLPKGIKPPRTHSKTTVEQ